MTEDREESARKADKYVRRALYGVGLFGLVMIALIWHWVR